MDRNDPKVGEAFEILHQMERGQSIPDKMLRWAAQILEAADFEL